MAPRDTQANHIKARTQERKTAISESIPASHYGVPTDLNLPEERQTFIHGSVAAGAAPEGLQAETNHHIFVDYLSDLVTIECHSNIYPTDLQDRFPGLFGITSARRDSSAGTPNWEE